MASEFAVPDWLQPPSQAQDRQLAIAEEQVKAKGVSMLRKQIGWARMKEDAAKWQQAGLDEGTARKKALLDNADLLFTDEPDAVAKIMDSDEANAIRERAHFLLQQKADQLQTYRENILDLRNRDLERKQTEGETRLQLGEAQGENRLLQLQINQANQTRLTEQGAEANRIRREGVGVEKAKEERLLSKDIEADTQLRILESKLSQANTALQAARASGRNRLLFQSQKDFETKLAGLEKNRAEAERAVAERRRLLGGTETLPPEPQPSTEAPKKRYIWTPEGLVPKE